MILKKDLRLMRLEAWGRFLVAVVSMVALLVVTNSAFAKPDKDSLKFFVKNGVYYYDDCSSGSGSSGYGDIVVCGTTIEEKIWTGLTSFLTKEQAAGVMGNMAHESGASDRDGRAILDSPSPARHEGSFINSDYDFENDPGPSYGIGLIQWSFQRRVDMLNLIKTTDESLMTYIRQRETYGNMLGDAFLEAVGDDATSKLISIELGFLKHELDTNDAYHGLYNQATVYDAAKYFLENVERPQDPYISAHPERATDAARYYDLLKDFHCDGGNDQSGGGSSNNIINQTAIKLAWSDGGHTDKNDAKPEYKTALEQVGFASSGDPEVSAGRSCDVFVATVMRYSEYDTEFRCCGASNVGSYMADHPEKYEVVKPSGDEYQESDLQPGDILWEPGHVALYVRLDDGTGRVASASNEERMPDTDRTWDGDNGYHHYPKVYRPKNIPGAAGSIDNPCGNSSGNGTIPEGGMTQEQANAHMEVYANLDMAYWGSANIPLNQGCKDGDLSNCVAYSHYFLARYTSCTQSFLGNGKDIVAAAAETCGLQTGDTPRPYAVFSTTGPSVYGHTGVVLGIDGDTLILGEAGCSTPASWTGAHPMSLAKMERAYGVATFVYTDSILNLRGNF